MKLSDFLTEKKIKFNEGVPIIIDKKLNGEVTFHDLTKDRIEKINNEVIQKMTEEDNDNTLLYKLFSQLTDIETDVDINIFIEMLNNPPCNQFALIEEEYMKIFNDLFDRIETKNRIEENANLLIKKIPEQPKSKQEIKQELMTKLSALQENTPENKKLRKEIFIQLAELED